MDSSLTVENIIQFIVLFSGLLTGFIRFNNKTEKNSLMIKHIEKDIEHVKEETKIVFAKLEVKIGDLEDDVKSIASDIAEIKGFIKQLSLSK
jgi:peptidoglycan hydrolase CwlO-like protein